jgi:exosome complex component RRP45
MPREAEISVNERAFIEQALQENVRLDGRPFDAFRRLELSFGEEYGVADVKLGKTRVIARISIDVTAPIPERKFDGVFQIVTEFSPMASPAFEPGRCRNDPFPHP